MSVPPPQNDDAPVATMYRPDLVFPPGMIWLVGAGPGDPGLMTLHGVSALERADHVIHDSLIDLRILDWCRPHTPIESAGKRGGRPSPKQRDITLRLIELARAGKRVVRLKGGDPFVFGRGGEEALALARAGVMIRITPGITAGIGALTYAGIPLTHRDSNHSVTFLTGHDQGGQAAEGVDWSAIARGSELLVMFMAMRNIDELASRLIASGRAVGDPVAVISNATMADQRTLISTLGSVAADIREAAMTAPAVICIGPNVRLREAILLATQLDRSSGGKAMVAG